MRVDKSFLTNLIAFLSVVVSFFIYDNVIRDVLLYGGLFALSGAITNQLAIYMLFNKVPLLYGSGVIEENFDKFKNSIKNLMIEQFFTKEAIEKFLKQEEKKLDLTPIVEKTDFNPAFDALTKAVMGSNFGGMLGMFGGEKALEGLREPFVSKLKSSIIAIVNTETFNENIKKHINTSGFSNDLIVKIEEIIDTRLNELTPKMVNEIVQKLIKEHLGWLVLWGGVFGGILGVISSFLI